MCGPCVRKFWNWASEHGEKHYRVGPKGKGSKYIAFPTGVTKKNGRRTTRNHKRASNSEVRELIEAAKAQGWTVTPTGSGHWRFLSPDKSVPPIIVASTPSDHRGLKNMKSLMRRHGLKVNGRKTSRREVQTVLSSGIEPPPSDGASDYIHRWAVRTYAVGTPVIVTRDSLASIAFPPGRANPQRSWEKPESYWTHGGQTALMRGMRGEVVAWTSHNASMIVEFLKTLRDQFGDESTYVMASPSPHNDYLRQGQVHTWLDPQSDNWSMRANGPGKTVRIDGHLVERSGSTGPTWDDRRWRLAAPPELHERFEIMPGTSRTYTVTDFAADDAAWFRSLGECLHWIEQVVDAESKRKSRR